MFKIFIRVNNYNALATVVFLTFQASRKICFNNMTTQHTQEMRSIPMLDDVATLVHYLFTQTTQQILSGML